VVLLFVYAVKDIPSRLFLLRLQTGKLNQIFRSKTGFNPLPAEKHKRSFRFIKRLPIRHRLQKGLRMEDYYGTDF